MLIEIKASRDGFSPDVFHSKCDNQGPTFTIIQTTTGYLLGGFAGVSWKSAGKVSNPNSFIFTLTNPHKLTPTKLELKDSSKFSMHDHPSFGPSFGGGSDICVTKVPNQFNGCAINLSSFKDTTGYGNTLFAGKPYFTANEIEVFRLM